MHVVDHTEHDLKLLQATDPTRQNQLSGNPGSALHA